MTQAGFTNSNHVVLIASAVRSCSAQGKIVARRSRSARQTLPMLVMFMASLSFWLLLTGCGGGGYPGATLSLVSAASLAIDSGQSIAVTANASDNVPLSWTLGGASCTGKACGSLSSATGQSTTYTAPSGLTAQLNVTLQVAVAGTASSQTVHITANPLPEIGTPPPAGTQGVAYTTTISAQGGTAPLHLSLVSGNTPPGLTFNAADGALSGTPTASGTYNALFQVTDSSSVPYMATATESFVIAGPGTAGSGSGGSGSGSGGTGTGSGSGSGSGGSGSGGQTAALTVLSTALPSGVLATPYSASLQATGGAVPYAWSIAGGALPAGLVLNASTGIISGLPVAAGTFPFTAQVKDSTGTVADGVFSIAVTAPATTASLTLTSTALPSGTAGVAYSSSIGVGGGTAPYGCSISAGTLPAGLALGADCSVTGVPTMAGTATITVAAVDAATPANTTSGVVTLTINPAATLMLSSPPAAIVGSPYTGTIQVTGGMAPYVCSLVSGSLPAGVTLGADCTLSGTPTTSGTTSISVSATDASTPANTVTGAVTLTTNPAAATLTLGTLVNGTVGTPYSATLAVGGGTAPYNCTITAGTLPAGLTLGTQCAVSGTPTTAGTTTVTVQATDASTPANSTSGQLSLAIEPLVSLSLSAPPAAAVGTPYNATIGVVGGSAPYTCSITAGSLPAGLLLGSNCAISGTPTTAGTAAVTVQAMDAASPAHSTTGQVSLTVAPSPLSLSEGTLPAGVAGASYSATLGVIGGTAPYSCLITAGSLPAGLALSGNCLVSGTPTVAGNATVTVRATDSADPANATSGQVSLTVNPATILTVTAPASATVGTPYSGSIGVGGGTAPYSCVITAGTLPQGLNLGTHCSITGTPTVAGTANLTVQATDASSPANSTTSAVSVVVNAAPQTLVLGSPAAATVSTPYTGAIPVTGGTAPYTCTVSSGTLPAGLTLGTNCSLTGTPTTVGSTAVGITATDSSNPAITHVGPVTITVNPLAPLTFTGSLANAVLGSAYLQTLAAAGGLAPYTYAVTAGALPAGLNLSGTGVIGGTPTSAGAYSFTVTATDSEGTPQTKSLPLLLLVAYAPTASDAEFTGPYAFLFQGYDDAAAGLLTYQTATAGSLTANGTGVVSSGELDSNHQSSTATGSTISSQTFLGTYTLGSDGRGSLTLSTLDAEGTVAQTHTYAIALKTPASPATVATEGSLIEYDSNQAAGTRGSGTLLAQTTTAFAAGLNGSYVFGLQGDTPCLVSCALNLNLFGPVAEVGQFTTANGVITGTADANIAATNYANASLTGSFAAADGNGRVSLNLTNAELPGGVSPTDYAVYLINASQAFVISTDKHSAFVLLAGQARLQTEAAFSSTSASGPYVGYENSPTNPGLVGQTLQNVLNFSTATIFQGRGNGSGSCTTNSVTQGGVTALINGLSGLGSIASTLQDVFGSYTRTGTSSCPVASNGREVLNYVPPVLVGNTPTPRVAYLYAPNQGFFLETGYAGLGWLEQQSGAPFTVGTLDGTFVYGSTTASSAASTNASGTFTANGQGSANATLDENVGVGTVNVLELGVAGTFPYNLTSATFGTYQLGTTDVIYAITPERFVLVDTNATTTSPSVALIY